jgi:hypothetical protein
VTTPLKLCIPPQTGEEQLTKLRDGYLASQRIGDMRYSFCGSTAEEALRLLREHLKHTRRK